MQFNGHEPGGKTAPRRAVRGPAAAPRSADDLLRLQRTLGNRHVDRLLRHPDGDQYERPPAAAVMALQRTAGNAAVSRLAGARERRDGLPAPLLASVARESGIDLSDVTVHRSSAEPARVDAHAYATGSDIHLAPGADRHLAHEAWHLVQQRQGRVPVTEHLDGRALNTDPRLEDEADVMGDRLSAAPATGPVTARVTQPPQDAPAQLKSKFDKITPKEKDAETPIATLSAAFDPFFKAAGQPEMYNFGSQSPFINVSPSKYAGKFDRAGKVEASIDGSWKGGNGSDRDNGIISVYGHFGVMERAIFQRPDRGNTYDGGHLIEHTMMTGREADVHGNLAPQENKHFNQSQMRGWERIPEELQQGLGHSFTYLVEVKYSGDQYTRTGQKLLDAKVLPGYLIGALPTTGPYTEAALKARVVTFRRWVPTTWETDTREPSGANFPSLSLTHGVQYHNLRLTAADAEDSISGIGDTSHTGPTPIRKRLSGTLGTFITGITALGLVLILPPAASHKAVMYQPEPQDLLDQPPATATPLGLVPATLPAAAPGKKLKAQMKLSDLVQNIANAQLRKKKTSGKMPPFLNESTIDERAKKESKEYAVLRRDYLSKSDGVLLARALHNLGVLSPYTKANFANTVKTAGLSVNGRNKLLEIANDSNFIG